MDTYDVIIIGGGPAGLTAGLYTCRAGLRSLLIEKSFVGGQIVNAPLLENYPGFPDGISGFDLMEKMQKQAEKFGLEIVTGEEVTDIINNASNGFNIVASGNQYKSAAVIITSGGAYSKLGVKGEEEFTGKGVSYCATCDGFLYRDKEVVVVGGGDTAITDALELSNHARKVTVIHRRDKLRASDVLQKKAFADTKLHFLWNSVIDTIDGDGLVSTINVKNVKTGELSKLNTDGVFIAIGIVPNSSGFESVADIDSNGNIIVTDTALRTKTPGVFAAGDIRQGSPRQVSSAVGDGAIAALSAFHYLRE